MYDTHNGREMVSIIYRIRWVLTLLLLFTLIISYLFRTPLDRVYLMLLELQLMCNLAIFHVCLPGNVEISSQIMKVFVSFNFFKDITYNIMGKETSEVSGEKALEFLGQRATYNYDSFNLMFNMETLGIVFFLYIMKVLIIWCLYMYNKHGKPHKNKKITYHYQAVLLDQAIYHDLLNLFLRAFLEFGIATFIVFQAPSWNADVTLANILLTILVVSCMFLGLPYIYYLIYMETMISNMKVMTFKEKFGMNLLGAKIDLRNRDKRKYFFWHVFSFVAVRLVFLIIAFTLTIGWVQIILLLYLFLYNTCRVGYMLPMHGKWNNFLAVFNQFSHLICVYHLMCFTDWLDREEQYLCGFSFLYYVGFFIIVNLLYILLDLILYIKYMLLMYWPKFFIYLNIFL